MIRFTIPGQPQGKGRARAFVRHGNVAHYTPAKTRSYEGVITTLAMEAMKGRPPSDRPIEIILKLFYPVPASWPKWKQTMAYENKIIPTVKPDVDNVEKAVKDACNGVAYRDDCQVCDVYKTKRFSDRPRVEVIIQNIPLEPAQIKTKPAM